MEKAKCGIGSISTDSRSDAADKFNQHFASVAEQLRSRLLQVPLDFSRLENFVLSCKDPDVKYSISLISKSFIVDNLRLLSPSKATGVDRGA